MADLKNGQRMRTVIGDSVDDQIFVLGEYEPEVTAVLRHLAGKSTTFVDVGCNIGFFSCLFARTNPKGTVFAIDPNPHMVERAAENLALNGAADPVLLNLGIGASNCSMELHIPRNRHSLSSMAFQPVRGVKGGVENITVDVRPLFDVVPRERVQNGLLKVDVEGFEYEVFRGISAQDAAAFDYVVFELSGQNLSRAGVPIARLFDIPWFADYALHMCMENGALAPLRVDQVSPDTESNVVMARRGLPADALSPFLS